MFIKDFWRLTSNWPGGMKIPSMGVKNVHPLDGMDEQKSIKSRNSILSILVAPNLHQNNQPNQLVWRLGF